MTAQARASLNMIDTYLAQQNTKLTELENTKVELLKSKNADEAKININKNAIEATKKSIVTFQEKREALIKQFPELAQKETLVDKFTSLFNKKPVLSSPTKVVQKQASTEDVASEFNLTESPRNSANRVGKSDTSETTPLVQQRVIKI